MEMEGCSGAKRGEEDDRSVGCDEKQHDKLVWNLSFSHTDRQAYWAQNNSPLYSFYIICICSCDC